MAAIEVGINQPSGKYSDFIMAQNDYGSEFGATMWLKARLDHCEKFGEIRESN